MSTVLHAKSLSSWISTVDRYLANQHSDMLNLKTKLEQISDLGYDLTGTGGTAIKSFYRESHIPLIYYYQVLTSEVRTFLQKYETARSSFDPSESTFVESTFLENELSNALRNFKNKVISMTDQTNDIINSVADIVSLPKIDDTRVITGIEQCIQKALSTSNKLQEFDHTQLQALQIIIKDVNILRTYISNLSSLISSGDFDITRYKSGDIDKYTWFQDLKETMNTKENIPDDIKQELMKEAFKDKLGGIINFFSTVNQLVTASDNTMTYLKAAIATAYGATSYTSKALLKVHMKSNNMFTLRVSDTWKAKTGYANPLANFIHKMQKGPAPTNYFGRELSNFLKSYSNPSAVLKHFIGYQKNKTTATAMDTIARRSVARAKYGTKEFLSDVTAKAGFAKASKAIPYIGTGVTVASNLSEFTKPENTDKSLADKTVRFSIGTAMDLGAAAAGAKAGAAAGMVMGGVVGAVVGGAIGAAGGVFLSSKLKASVTNFAGKTVNKIEQGAGKVIQSIGSWFK